MIVILSCSGYPSFAAIRTGAVNVTIVPSQATVESGASLQLKAQVVGAANSSITWTAVLGSVSPSGLYTAPNVESSTVDTVSAISVADPTKYVTVELTVEASGNKSSTSNTAITSSTNSLQSKEIYTLTSQQPATLVPYANNPGSFTSKRLPANVMSHLYTSPQGVRGHDIAVCAFTDCGNPMYSPGGSQYGGFSADTPGSGDQGYPFYYASASDPWYKLTGCGISSMNGMVFHAPNQAQYNIATADDAIAIWDQATGFAVGFYTFNQAGTKLPVSTCAGTGPSSCAVAWNHSGNSYCQAEQFTNERDWGWGGKAAALGGGDALMPGAELSTYSGIVRQQELMQGQINHAIRIIDDCHNANNTVVFPNTSRASGLVCGQTGSGPQSNSRPPGGALLFLDYSDGEINGMNLPAWQKTYITALSHYGAYVGVTGGTHGYVPFGASTLEGSQAWKYAGLTNPFYAWLSTQPGITHFIHGDGSIGYRGSIFTHIPTIRGTDVRGHMYMADPCVVKTMAGLPGGC